MTIMSSLTVIKMTKTMNPTNMALWIMALSIPMAMVVFKFSSVSWLPFVMILTFSSGMMTLFIYASSLTPNEKSKSKKMSTLWTILILMAVSTPSSMTKQTKTSMKSFSNQTMILIMTTTLILTMLAISMHGFNPNQSVASTF